MAKLKTSIGTMVKQKEQSLRIKQATAQLVSLREKKHSMKTTDIIESFKAFERQLDANLKKVEA